MAAEHRSMTILPTARWHEHAVIEHALAVVRLEVVEGDLPGKLAAARVQYIHRCHLAGQPTRAVEADRAGAIAVAGESARSAAYSGPAAPPGHPVRAAYR